MAVRVGHQLVRLLRRRIQRERVIHILMHAERHRRVGAVHTRRRRVRQMLHPIVATSLKDVNKTHNVAVDVRVRVLQRVPDPGLCRQMNHLVEPTLTEQRLHARAIRHVQLLKREARPTREARQPRVLQRGIVIVVQIVDADDLVAPLQERDRNVGADEAGSTGQQNSSHDMQVKVVER